MLRLGVSSALSSRFPPFVGLVWVGLEESRSDPILWRSFNQWASSSSSANSASEYRGSTVCSLA